MVSIVEHVNFIAEFFAQPLKQLWSKSQIVLGGPLILRRGIPFRGFVEHLAAPNAICAAEAWYAGLRTDSFIAQAEIMPEGADGFLEICAASVSINQHRFSRSTPEQLIKGNVEALGFDVPERGIDGGDGAHRGRAAPPVRAFIQILPRVFDFARVAVDEKWNNVVSEIAGNGEFAAVEGGVAQPIDSILGREFERDEISAWRADDDFGVSDLHG